MNESKFYILFLLRKEGASASPPTSPRGQRSRGRCPWSRPWSGLTGLPPTSPRSACGAPSLSAVPGEQGASAALPVRCGRACPSLSVWAACAPLSCWLLRAVSSW